MVIFLQFLCKIMVNFLQFLCKIMVIFLQILCKIMVIFLQFLCKIMVIFLQFLCKIIVIFLQFLCKIFPLKCGSLTTRSIPLDPKYSILSVTSRINCIVASCLINVVYLTAWCLYQVMMTLHFLNDVANDAESTYKSKMTS